MTEGYYDPIEEDEMVTRCSICGHLVIFTQDSTTKNLQYAKCLNCASELNRLAVIEENYADLKRSFSLLEKRVVMTSEFISKWRNFNG